MKKLIPDSRDVCGPTEETIGQHFDSSANIGPRWCVGYDIPNQVAERFIGLRLDGDRDHACATQRNRRQVGVSRLASERIQRDLMLGPSFGYLDMAQRWIRVKQILQFCRDTQLAGATECLREFFRTSLIDPLTLALFGRSDLKPRRDGVDWLAVFRDFQAVRPAVFWRFRCDALLDRRTAFVMLSTARSA